MQANNLFKLVNNKTKFPIIFAITAVVVLLFTNHAGQNIQAAGSELELDQTAFDVSGGASDFDVTVTTLNPSQSSNGRCTPDPIRTSWFYNPPSNTSLETVINNFDIFVMNRMEEKWMNQVANADQGPILQYVKFDAISDACFQAKKAKGTPCNCSIRPRANQVASEYSDICWIRDNHPDWFLRDGNGKLVYWNEFVMMDPGNQGWREFWVSRIKSYQAKYPNWDGVFMDNMSTRFGRHGTDFIDLQRYPTEKSYQDAVIGFINYGQSNYFKPTNRIMYANLSVRWGHQEPFVRYIGALSGAMDEFWAVTETGWYSVKAWEARLWRAQEALKRGKSMMLISQGSKTDLNRELFGLASYLLVTGDKMYFRYTTNNGSGGYSQMWLYDNYKARLGSPTGYYTRSGNTWTRNFTNGKVTVNPETRKATITMFSAGTSCG